MTVPTEVELCIVGAGPAGLAAARTAAGLGVGVLILDENPATGGQIFRQAMGRQRPVRADEPPSHQVGHRLIEDVEAAAIEVRGGSVVWDADAAARTLHVAVGDRSEAVVWQQLILATGAQDLVVPFPGWTLPGVITAGAAQVLVRGQGIVPGRRAVVAGTGPLLLPTVTALRGAGVDLAAVLEANGAAGVLRNVPRLLLHRQRRGELLHYLRQLRRKPRMQHRRVVLRAQGNGQIESVVTVRLDRQGQVVAGSEQTVACDLLCVGHGLQPVIELGLRLGCRAQYLDARGGWGICADARMATSVPGVFVAGEIAGVGGAEVAMAEGEVAALAACDALGRGTRPDLLVAQRRASRERRISDGLLAAFPIPPALYGLIDDETILCRCEDVSFADVREAAELHGASLRAVKMGSRAGMGPCQARICHRPIGDVLRLRLGGADEPVACPKVQMPIKPVSVQQILRR